MAALTTPGRKRVRRFAWKDWDKEPIENAEHVQDAASRFMQTRGPKGEVPTEEQRDAAWQEIRKAAKEYGVKLSEKSWHDLKSSFALQAMALVLPATPGAPNRHPFRGVLCKVDQPSTRAPEGSNGKRVLLPRALAEKLIPTLLGQGVDFRPNLDGHDVQRKCGVIMGAKLEGDDLTVEGHLFDKDFPDLVPKIHAHMGEVGMSFELGASFEDNDASVLKIIDSPGFTGAAILLRKDAAYEHTRLVASAKTKKGSTTVELKDIQALLEKNNAALLASVDSKITGLAATIDLAAKKHAGKVGREAFEADADDLDDMHAKAKKLHAEMGSAIKDADGDDDGDMEAVKAAHEKLGDHLKAAHKHVRAMKAASETYFKGEKEAPDSQADKKVLSIVEDLKKELKGSTDEIASLKAQVAGNAQDPGRKTMSAEITALLAKGDLSFKEDEKPTAAQAAANVYAAMDKLKITDDTARMKHLMDIPRQ